MKTLTLIVLTMASINAFSQENQEISNKIIALEKAALERWNNGDVYGFLEIYADDIVYFDPWVEKRIDGLKAITELYKPLQGKIKVSYYEMSGAKVQAVENMAVLTFNLKSCEGEQVHQWNSTEVFQREKDGTWKIIQSHWSLTKPNIK
jgi:ketosteroid isomerase-like protein